MRELPFTKTSIVDDFWGERLTTNAKRAIFHQWEQLEQTGCINNFRLVADSAEGVRLGYFFADSDAYKWLDAAARIYQESLSNKLKILMDQFINLIERTQEPDGYIYTYNQFYFPGTRWCNLQIEHELYCMGHLIEAGVSHYLATSEDRLLTIVTKSADLITNHFLEMGPMGTPGHEEIEIALIRLYKVVNRKKYLDQAVRFIEQRGRIKPFVSHYRKNNNSHEERKKQVIGIQNNYLESHPEYFEKYPLPADNIARKPPWGTLRWFFDVTSGKYFQQHTPVRKQTKPVGHAVRFAYLETAIAKLYHEKNDPTLLNAIEKAWNHMVTKRMYVTGGVGSQPSTEGFGRDYELDPQYSYSETCAALGVILWNWEMSLITREAKYADLTEWQFYNAAAVGLGQDGISYLYNNPLTSHGGLTRRAWFKCPCCPSNISRIWAELAKYIYSFSEDEIWIHQYIGSRTSLDQNFGLRMDSSLPWEGKATLTITSETLSEKALHFRVPSWSDGIRLQVNQEPQQQIPPPSMTQPQTACGYNPMKSWYYTIERKWNPGDTIYVDLIFNIEIRSTHPKVSATRGKVAITRGPLVYCLESVDNPNVDIHRVKLDPLSLHSEFKDEPFPGVITIIGQTRDGQELQFIPYYLWANRGNSQMTVYVNI